MFRTHSLFFSFLALYALLLGEKLCAQTVEKPNIILILSDDQGSLDAGCYGAKDLATPNLDDLAKNGVRFTQFYVGAALCSPSRAAILSGMSPQSSGLSGNASSHEGVAGLPSERILIAEMLKENGYATGHIGKWHLGYTPETMPNGQGFDYSFGHMGGCIDNYSHFFYWNGPNRHDLWENGEMVYHDGRFFPDLMAEKAEEFIKKNSEEPFFLYYAINVPHYPYQPTEKWRKHYQSMEMPRRDYAGFVSTMDENIGKLVASLEKQGLKDNTIIIFLSDHGHSVEERAFKGGGYAGPYRGAKMSLFEGGIRVPCIISWPKQIGKGEVRDQFCMSMDLYPTIAQWIDADNLPQKIEGIAINDVIHKNVESPRNQAHWKMGRQWAVRKGNWKLVGNPRDPTNKLPLNAEQDQLFLSNLTEDVSESKNLAEAHPNKVNELIQTYLEWTHAEQSDIPIKLPPLNNKAFGAKVRLQHPTHPKYRAKGGASLVDNTRGTYDFLDGNWLGFLKNNLEAEMELEQLIQVDTISFRCMQDQGNYIFLPEYFEVSLSTDGTQFGEPIQLKTDVKLLKQNARIYEFDLPIGKRAKYLKIKAKNIKQNPSWHRDPGADAFLFIDEIILK